MKRGTPDHPKTKALCSALGLRRYQGVGLLESLWHFAAQYAKRGDVGRWENTAIGTALDWEHDPDALIRAFISSGYLEECPKYRLLIHDWEAHCDQTVKRAEEVVNQGFARNQLAKASIGENNDSPDENAMLGNPSQPRAKAISQSHKPKANAMEPPPLPASLGVGSVPELWADFVRHRSEIKKPLTPTAAKRLIAQLEEMGPERAAKALAHSTANGWRGVFEPDEIKARNGHGQARPKLGSRK